MTLELIDPGQLALTGAKMLVYGDVGQGKTSFAATAPNCLFVSVEAGEAALRHPPHPLDPRTKIVRIETFDQMRQLYYMVRTNQNGFGEFDSIVIDSLSDLQDKCLFEVMARAEAKDPKRPKGRPQRDDWQEVAYTLRRMCMRFRDLPKHVIMTALYRQDTPQTGFAVARAVRASLSPAVYKAISAYVDILAYLIAIPERNQEGQPTGRFIRRLVLQDPTMQVHTKVRYPLPSFIDNPTFEKLANAINNGNGA